MWTFYGGSAVLNEPLKLSALGLNERPRLPRGFRCESSATSGRRSRETRETRETGTTKAVSTGESSSLWLPFTRFRRFFRTLFDSQSDGSHRSGNANAAEADKEIFYDIHWWFPEVTLCFSSTLIYGCQRNMFALRFTATDLLQQATTVSRGSRGVYSVSLFLLAVRYFPEMVKCLRKEERKHWMRNLYFCRRLSWTTITLLFAPDQNLL